MRICLLSGGWRSLARSLEDYCRTTKHEIVLHISQKKGRDHYSIIKYDLTLPLICSGRPMDHLTDGELLLDIYCNQVDCIILAGFMRKLDVGRLPRSMPIFNFHPSLLPKHGGKGMYGLYVHEDVIKSRDERVGFTIHRVNEEYDGGEIVYQYSIDKPSAMESAIDLQDFIKNKEREFGIPALFDYLGSCLRGSKK